MILSSPTTFMLTLVFGPYQEVKSHKVVDAVENQSNQQA
jgi:hypothetical protein